MNWLTTRPHARRLESLLARIDREVSADCPGFAACLDSRANGTCPVMEYQAGGAECLWARYREKCVIMDGETQATLRSLVLDGWRTPKPEGYAEGASG